MTAELVPFTYRDAQLRCLTIDGEPWFVAGDAARMLGYRDAHNLARRLDDDEKGTHSLSTLGGTQQVGIISESGLYSAILGSQVEKAKEIKRWVTGTVLPEIRKTGGYNTAPTLAGPQLVAAALIEANRMLEAKDERIAELEPKAEIADKLLDAEGDLSVRDAAQSLTRAGIKVGQNRLFTLLDTKYGWIARAAGDGRYRVKQAAIEAGWMSVLPQSHYHPRTGVLVLDPPQPRITPKGLQRIFADHGGDQMAIGGDVA